MIDHVGFTVSDYGAARAFYLAALKPLGFGMVMEFPETGGLGPEGKPVFWISGGASTAPALHVAFAASNAAAVRAFHAAALAAGGRDNGAPGLRPQYHPGYYAAFVLDPDGHNIEAVFHGGDA